jgi:uncharacterized protein (DUF305 family)
MNSKVALAAALYGAQSVAIAYAFGLCCVFGVGAGAASTNNANPTASAKDAESNIQCAVVCSLCSCARQPGFGKDSREFAAASCISASYVWRLPSSMRARKMFSNAPQRNLYSILCKRTREHKLRAASGSALLLFAVLVVAASLPVNVFGSPSRAEQTVPASQPVVVQPGAPGKPSKTLPPSTTGTLPSRSQADVEFMQGMILHHAQAVEMTALIASHTDNQDLRLLGAKISSSQSDEIKFMQRWLAARGEPTSMAMPGMSGMDASGKPMALMPGMLTPDQMDALRNAKGAEFDHLFLTGMIQHHNGALIMVQDLFDTAGAGQEADIFNFATDADNTQRAEIKIMQSMLEKKSPEVKQ